VGQQLKRQRWVGYVEQSREMHNGFWWGKLKESVPRSLLSGENNIKICREEVLCDGMFWISVVQNRDKYTVSVNVVPVFTFDLFFLYLFFTVLIIRVRVVYVLLFVLLSLCIHIYGFSWMESYGAVHIAVAPVNLLGSLKHISTSADCRH
jgi:hypothetical protein